MSKGLIYFNLHAEAYYSGAEYDETFFVTPDDYMKYFGKNRGVIIEGEVQENDNIKFTDASVEEAYKLAKSTWHNKEVSVGELDGKHSDVYGDVYVDFFDDENIRDQYAKHCNDGNNLMLEMLYTNGINDYDEQQACIKEINENVEKLVKEVGYCVEARYRVPYDKVEELNKLVEDFLNGKC